MAMHDLQQHLTVIDKDCAPRLMAYGEELIAAKLPVGTQVVYPPPPLAPVERAAEAIRRALDQPEEGAPLHALLRPGMRVTVAVSDAALAPDAEPDVRRELLAQVLATLAEQHVEDVHVVIARGLRRALSVRELKQLVGAEIFARFYPARLSQHDGEDPQGVVQVGSVETGEVVELNRRAAESDLLVGVSVKQAPHEGGYRWCSLGLTNYRTLSQIYDPQVLLQGPPQEDPELAPFAQALVRVGRHINRVVPMFQVEAVLNNRFYGRAMACLAHNEDHYTDLDWLKVDALRLALKKAPRNLKRHVWARVVAGPQLIAVHAGAPEAVHSKTRQVSAAQQLSRVRGQADIVILAVPAFAPGQGRAALSPLELSALVHGYFHNMRRGAAVLRQGGTLIVSHPCTEVFNPEQHPGDVEFFNRLLPQTRDVHAMRQRHEREFAENPAFVDRYRFGGAAHGAQPFFMWYAAEVGRRWCGRVIAAGARHSRVPHLLGWQRADNLADALAMARAAAPQTATITLLHEPPFFVSDVAAPKS